MNIQCVWEHNEEDTILYARDFPGAYARGASLAEATEKLSQEVFSFSRWLGNDPIDAENIQIVQEKYSQLQIRDADSDVIFEAERQPLTTQEYEKLKSLVMKSAMDFQKLYDAVPDKGYSSAPARRTFYGPVPRTAEEMYLHTKNVNEFYFWEIGVDTDNEGSIVQCRARGFEKLEQMPDFLEKGPVIGSYGEEWSLRKLLRRFLWHDRIHAKAMYRMAVREFGRDSIPDPFYFETERRDTYGMA